MNNTSTAIINVTNGLLLLSITISFQQSCLKMAILKYLHKAILKLHTQVIEIVCALTFYLLLFQNTAWLSNQNIYKYASDTLCKSAALRLGEVTGFTHTRRVTFNSSSGLNCLFNKQIKWTYICFKNELYGTNELEVRSLKKQSKQKEKARSVFSLYEAYRLY